MFSDDLKNWRLIEKEFVRELLKINKQREIWNIEFAPDRRFEEWDVRITFRVQWKEMVKSYEVKHDKKSEETNNVWFEYRYNHKPSWIINSDADVIVYYINGKFYYQDRKELLAKLFDINYSNKVWGDNNASDLLVVSKEYLHELFKELW